MTPNIINVHPSTPFKTIKQLIAYAKARPGELSYSSAIVGTSPQLTMELLKLQLKFDIVHIPYRIAQQGVTLESTEGEVARASILAMWYDAAGVGPQAAPGCAYAVACARAAGA